MRLSQIGGARKLLQFGGKQRHRITFQSAQKKKQTHVDWVKTIHCHPFMIDDLAYRDALDRVFLATTQPVSHPYSIRFNKSFKANSYFNVFTL